MTGKVIYEWMAVLFLTLMVVAVSLGCQRESSAGVDVEGLLAKAREDHNRDVAQMEQVIIESNKAFDEQMGRGKAELELLSVRDVLAAYQGNPVAWETRYKGRQFVIRGVVVTIRLVDKHMYETLGLDVDHYGHVGLVSEQSSYLPSSGSVQCLFDENRREEYADLQRGDIVEIEGTAGAKGTVLWDNVLGPHLADCGNVTVTGRY